jgi:hypothetical protein
VWRGGPRCAGRGHATQQVALTCACPCASARCVAWRAAVCGERSRHAAGCTDM